MRLFIIINLLMKMKLFFKVSEISIVTGHNKFQSKRDYLLNFWKSHHSFDYMKYMDIFDYIEISDMDIIQTISEKNNINIMDNLKESIDVTNIDDINKIKNNINIKFNVTDININDKKQVMKSIDNIINTRYGVRNENNILTLYENRTGNIIINNNIYHKRKVYEDLNIIIYMCGKIDGMIQNQDSIIEIKNRMNKLFYKLKDYEKVQLMCYMHLFQFTFGQLIEGYCQDNTDDSNNNTEINIIKIKYDYDYMKNILSAIIIFSKFYYQFINNHEMKLKLLESVDDNEVDFNI